MLPPAHFAVGMAPPFAICAAIYLARRGTVTTRFLVVAPLAMVAGGVWATGPDIPRFFRGEPFPYRAEWHRPGWPDIFFFHGTLDASGRGGSLWGTVAILLMFSCLIVVYIRHIILLSRRVRDLERQLRSRSADE